MSGGSPEYRDDSVSAAAHGEQPTPAGPVWTRPPRGRRERLTLEAIVTAAIGLADAEGLDAVSVRRIASVLKARPMSLYSFMSRKEDLVDLMVDQVLGEIVLDRLPTGWRAALWAIAHRTFEVGLRHPWIIAALSRHPALGPNALRHAEQTLAAVAELDLDSRQSLALLQAVDAYVLGYGMELLAEHQMRISDHLTQSAWRATAETYFERVVDHDRFPHLAKLGSADLLHRGGRADTFDDGLNFLLAGFANTLDPAPSDDHQG